MTEPSLRTTAETTLPRDVAALFDLMGDVSQERRDEWLSTGPGPSTVPARGVLNLLWMLEDSIKENDALKAKIAKLEAANV